MSDVSDGAPFVRAAEDWSRRYRFYFVDSYVVSDLLFGGKVPKLLPEVIGDLESALKLKGVVPRDAYLLAYQYQIERDGVVLRFTHHSYPVCGMGERAEERDVPRFWEERDRGDNPIGLRSCPGCRRQLPTTWALPFAQVKGVTPDGVCNYCLDSEVSTDGAPVFKGPTS